MSARAVGKRVNPSRAVGAPLFELSVGVAACEPPPAAAAALPGLSLLHIYSEREKENPPVAVLRVAENGHVVHLRRPRLSGSKRERKSRGKVNGLSAGAAARCKRFLLAADHSRVTTPFEGTLTVPEGEFGFAEFNHFLKNWRDRFERKWPGVPATWVKELTKKGTVHLHFVVVWLNGQRVPSLREFRKWNDVAWAEVVKSSHPSHEKTACRVTLVRTWERVVRYLSGYLTKAEGRQSDTGRMWGCIGRKFFPSSWVEIDVGEAERKEITRALVRCRQSKKVVLVSSATYSLRRRWGVKTERWVRLSASHPACFRGSFSEGFWMKEHKEDGYRLRLIRPRLHRQNGVKLWDQDEESRKVERRSVQQIKRFLRDDRGRVLRDSSGQKEFEWVDEIESVAAAWHYLPSAEVLRLLAFVRRDKRAGLTSCEVKWLRHREKMLSSPLR
jgi:hypothetical protein